VRRSERVVAARKRADAVCKRRERADVAHVQHGIRGCFDPQQSRRGSQCRLYLRCLCHVDEAALDAPGGDDVTKLFRRAVVTLERRNHMIALTQQTEHGKRRGRARGESKRCSAAFERGYALFQSLTIGIVGSDVRIATRVRAVCVAFVSRRQVNGRRDFARVRLDVATDVDGLGFEMHDEQLLAASD
jgi:hypothetical protein